MLALLAMSAMLGASSFFIGVLPLSFAFSATHLSILSNIGTGLLLGTALGVIIPEGIETLAHAHPSDIPITRIALCLLIGFTFMLIVEQLLSPHSHSHGGDIRLKVKRSALPNAVEFDAEMGEPEDELQPAQYERSAPPPLDSLAADALKAQGKAYPLTLGLVLHSLADGLALGVSFFPGAEEGATSSLSLVVFLAIVIHKAPTALALTTSLIQTSLPREDCRRHLAVFSVATPISAIFSYLVLTFLGVRNEEDWTGTSLVFSGGTFLYVATVLQPVSHLDSQALNNTPRIILIVLGIFIPFILGSVFGHGHD